jgi:hypothetical protein
VQRIDQKNERAKQRRLDNNLGLLGVRLGLNTLGFMGPEPWASKFLIGKVLPDHASPWEEIFVCAHQQLFSCDSCKISSKKRLSKIRIRAHRRVVG